MSTLVKLKRLCAGQSLKNASPFAICYDTSRNCHAAIFLMAALAGEKGLG
ncbi:hypothetical protein ISP15_12720 [Dyella jejuensis]|uniref:Uncharacterized protein n=1 Tax=Dyella jejuensis TaxID=1432009 RepID=A0ABW8JN63_9GAMM